MRVKGRWQVAAAAALLSLWIPSSVDAQGANSLNVTASGKVGVGTTNPQQKLHVADTTTPAVRLEQTTGTARTWDLGLASGAFFLRDVSNSNAVPFRVAAGAPTSSVEVSAGGFVGLGSASPAARLHVYNIDPTTTTFAPTKLLVENNNATSQPRELFELINRHGDVAFIFKNGDEPERWFNGTFAHNYMFDNQAHAGLEFLFGPAGNLTIAGQLSQNSDRNTKADIVPVDALQLLAGVVRLPISSWRKVGESATHIGPMAQDFADAFGLGADDKHIAPLDLAGVSVAAIQALYAELLQQKVVLEEQRQLIEQQGSRLREQAEAIAALRRSLPER